MQKALPLLIGAGAVGAVFIQGWLTGGAQAVDAVQAIQKNAVKFGAV